MEMEFECMPSDTHLVLATIYGYMCYPDPKDIKLREGFISQFIIKNYYEIYQNIPIDSALRAINFYDKNLRLKNAHKADINFHIQNGCLAGAMFITLLEMQKEDEPYSVNKAKFLTYENYSKRAVAMDGTRIEVTDAEKVGRAWNKYKWVAPMWACKLLLADKVLNINDVKDNPEIFFGLIDCMTKKAKGLNLQFECWEIPEGHNFPQIELETLGLNKINKEKLPEYNYKFQY